MFERTRRLISTEGMGGPALIMFIATVGGGACNFLYQLMMQNLAATELSEINTILAILLIASVPSMAISNVLIRYTAKYNAKGQDESISWIMRRTLLLALIIGAAAGITIILVLNTPEVRHQLKLTSSAGIVLLGLGITLSLLLPVGSGPLQGLQRFTAFGISYMGNYLIKLALGVGFVILGLGVAGAVGGVVVGISFGVAFSMIAMRKHLMLKGERAESREIWRFTIPTTIAALGFTVLTNVDVILAAILMEKDPANIYTAATRLASIILYLPGAIAAVMFPKISRLYAQRRSTQKLLKVSLFSTIMLSGLVALVFVLAPNMVLNILVPNNPYILYVAAPMRTLAIAMTLLGLANVFMLYGLATDGHAYVIILILAVGVLFLLIGGVAHTGLIFTPQILANIMAITGGFIIILSTIYLLILDRELGLLMRRVSQ
ncbi:MAG: oligosaccharide flippase family protein [Euryarchaeota archaeon]|nr:oligosaccharide flippase family protein [Euryarchaeota archaeon]